MTNINKHIKSILKTISELKSTDDKINTIASYTKLITAARRCSIFIFHKKNSQLISIYNDGIEGNIVLKSNVGLVGYVFHKNISVLENNTQNNPLFFKSIDKEFNFTTRSILAVPIIDEKGNTLGVIQLLNKKMDFHRDNIADIEALVPLIASLLIAENIIPSDVDAVSTQVSNLEELQKKFNLYLEDKHLYLMEDGCAYYKVLHMDREYFIGADSCYQLTDKSVSIDLYYYAGEQNKKEFLPFKISAMIDNTNAQLLISKIGKKENFTHCPLEKEI